MARFEKLNRLLSEKNISKALKKISKVIKHSQTELDVAGPEIEINFSQLTTNTKKRIFEELNSIFAKNGLSIDD